VGGVFLVGGVPQTLPLIIKRGGGGGGAPANQE